MTELEMEKNKQEFLRIFREKVHRDGAEDLLAYLEKSTFFQDPCSTKFHLAEDGGLCRHSLNVYYRLVSLIQHEKPPGCDLTPEEEGSAAIVALTHDLCKIGCYQKTSRNQKSYDPEVVAAAQSWQVKHDQQGDFIWVSTPGYTFSDPRILGTHGDTSLVMVLHFIHDLSLDEKRAIRFHMGQASDSNESRQASAAFEQSKLALLLHLSDMLASFLDESRDSN